MTTKAELVTFASDVGVDVSDSWSKGEVEAALVHAGYDPDNLTPKDDDVSETEANAADDEGQASTEGMDGDPNELGYAGTVPDEIENEAYTVTGQGKETARREREQVHRLRGARFYDEEADEGS